GPIPWWNRTWETAADSLARAMTLVRENALALLLSAGGVLALLTVLRRRRERQSRGQDTGYPIPDPTLARLAGRFEALLTSRGVPCPPHRPWSEHLARLAEIPAGATGSATPLDLHRAEAFVAAYNAARFGSGVPGSTSPPEGPAELLQALEGK
ncbi:MAG: DUF4129 domain-containing protein, partial [Armatimonadetes bacterium]|nr:DUF4129 domain-containing protein [Armatimonadota bacterium]